MSLSPSFCYNTRINDTMYSDSNQNSIWSVLCCCCGGGSSEPNTRHTIAKPALSGISQSLDLHNKQQPMGSGHNKGTSSDAPTTNSFGALQLDQLTATTATSLRHPIACSTVTTSYKNDATIQPGDVSLWDEPFGIGASGRIFKAIYLPLCQVLAVKVINRLDNENVERVLGEFRDQQELLPDCDRLMRIFGWYCDLEKNSVVIALEYMDMGSVYDSCFPNDRANSGDHLVNITAEEREKSGHKQIIVDKLTYDQIKYIARECLAGLHALHTCDPALVHREIKPQSILLSSSGDVKIADFGLLKRVNRESLRLCDSKGTEKYFSPERIQKNYGPKCDIWALGITLMEIFNQELIPPEKLDWFRLVGEGVDINDCITGPAPTDFVDFLKQCLTQDEKDRPDAKTLLNHRFVTRAWGNALDTRPNLSPRKFVTFADLKPDQKTLDKVLQWLELWILADENQNARVFSEGEPEYLKTCVHNLARFTGNTPEYIDRYIAEVYGENLNTSK